MKTCTACHIEKLETEFYKGKHSRNGIRSECKKCTNAKACKWASRNREHRRVTAKAWRDANKEHSIKYHAKWRANHRGKCHGYSARSKLKHRDAIRVRRAAWWKLNKSRLKADLRWYLAHVFRTRLRKCVVESRRWKCVTELLGCPIEDFRIYLETKFEPGMSWENHGEWEIDHIMPCAIFDLTKPEHQRRCFHFSNLQPLWKRENRQKSCKVVTNQFNLL